MIDFVHSKNGIIVLAHPWVLKNGDIIIKAIEDGIDGIECFDDSRDFLEVAEKKNLLKFMGSDYHGNVRN